MHYRDIKISTGLATILIVILLSFSISKAQNAPELKIHYLGHSAFIMDFDNGISIVTDYGKDNAWKDWGWDSPINTIGDLVPDVMTYSHTYHEDHFDSTRIPVGVKHILTYQDSLEISGISIKPIRVCEKNLNEYDNTAFLFTYKGLKILHLGDAQVEIINISDKKIRERIKNLFPQSLDLLFMTIDGPTKFTQQAADFVNLLQPKRVIPMHHWTEETLLNFVVQCKSGNKNNCVENLNSADYELFLNEQISPVKIITLERGPYFTK